MSVLDTDTRLIPPMQARQLLDAQRREPYRAKHRWEPGDETPTRVIAPQVAARALIPPPAQGQVAVPLPAREVSTSRLVGVSRRAITALKLAANAGRWGRR